jgi:ribonuclease HI
MTRRPPGRAVPEGRLVLYFDGASRGNPGPAAFGVHSPSGVAVSEAIGLATNNVAEWRGFLAALDAALSAGAEDVEIRADSELVLKQFLGEYRMRAPHLAPFLEEARRKASRIPRLRVFHVPRAENKDADALANRALDEKRAAPAVPRDTPRREAPPREAPLEPLQGILFDPKRT